MTAIHTSNDRFAVSVLMALGLHAVILLGVGFVVDFKPLTHPLETLDVVLVNWRSESKPDEADFLAQATQQGGGESTEATRPSQEYTGASPGLADGDDPLNQEEQASSVADAEREQILVEDDSSEFSQQITSIEQPEPPLPSAAELMQESMAMAKLQPGIQRDRESKSKLPKRKWISANTREYEFAAYMQAWVAKVERVGNLNVDGSVESIDIHRSSGHPQLDQAATRIVRLAGPYSPLPEHISTTVDVLHITRTWRFSRDFKGLN